MLHGKAKNQYAEDVEHAQHLTQFTHTTHSVVAKLKDEKCEIRMHVEANHMYDSLDLISKVICGLVLPVTFLIVFSKLMILICREAFLPSYT